MYNSLLVYLAKQAARKQFFYWIKLLGSWNSEETIYIFLVHWWQPWLLLQRQVKSREQKPHQGFWTYYTFSPVKSVDHSPRHPSGPQQRGMESSPSCLHGGYWGWFLFSACFTSVPCCLAKDNEDLTISLIRTENLPVIQIMQTWIPSTGFLLTLKPRPQAYYTWLSLNAGKNNR